MPRTAVREEFVEEAPLKLSELEEPLHGVKFIQRDIGAGYPMPAGAWEANAVDAYISSYLNDGWRLHSAQCVARRLEGTGSEQMVPVFSMVYVLEK